MLSIRKDVKPKPVMLKKVYIIEKYKVVNVFNDLAKVKLKPIKNAKALMFDSGGKKLLFIYGQNFANSHSAHLNYYKNDSKVSGKQIFLQVKKINGIYRPIFNSMRYNYYENTKEFMEISHFLEDENVKLYK